MKDNRNISNKAPRFIVAGGGTGGHIFPALSIANALKRRLPQAEFLFVGARGKMEMEKVPEAGYRIEGLTISGFNRSSMLKNFGLPFKLLKSFLQVRRIFNSFRPDAVIGVGGYSSFPVLRFAQARGIPTFIHEPNSFAGKSNILLGKKATAITVASDGMEHFFPKDKIVQTGNPVRANISENKVSREEGLRFFGLSPEKQTVLAIGGSLGARSINEALAAHLDELEAQGLQLIWQTGKTTIDHFRPYAAGKKNVWVDAFITDMDKAYAAADIIVSRSGSTLYELSIVGKPVLFVPYPYAAEDHQTANAKNMMGKKAAIMVADGVAKDELVPALIGLAQNQALRQELSNNISKYAITDADTRIADVIISKLNL